MNWIDAHAHLTDQRISRELPELLQECAHAGITRFVLGGIDPEEWERQRALISTYPGRIFGTFGLHPWWVATHAQEESLLQAGLEKLREEISRSPRACVGLGEIGLDFHPRFSEPTHAVQERIFREQLRLALAADLPVVLHIVRAHEAALRIIGGELRAASKSFTSGIVHSFAAEPAVARAYLDFGLVPSISAAVITRGKGSAFEKLKQTMVTLLAKEWVLETDAPDQPPYPRSEEGREVNAPVNLIRVAEAVARIRKESAAEVLDASRDTVLRIFGISPL